MMSDDNTIERGEKEGSAFCAGGLKREIMMRPERATVRKYVPISL